LTPPPRYLTRFIPSWQLSIFLATLSVLVVFFCHRLASDKIFAHLVQGRQLLAAEAFSTPAWQTPWWGSHLFLHLLVLWPEYVAWLCLLPAFFYAALLAGLTHRYGAHYMAICCIFFVVATYPCHYPLSPDWLGYLCALYFAHHLVRGPIALPALAACQIVWSNVHPSFFLGTLSLALVVAGAKWQKHATAPSWRLLHLAVIASATLLSPYSLRDGWQAAITWLDGSSLSIVCWPCFWLVVVGTLWLLARRRNWLVFLVLFTWVLLSSWQPCWMVPTVLLSLSQLPVCFDAATLRVVSLRLAVLAVVLACSVFTLRLSQLDQRWCGRFGVGIETETLPVEAAKFLTQFPCSGLLWSMSYNTGYLAWAGGHPMLADSLACAETQTSAQDKRKLLKNPQLFANMARRFDIRLLLLGHRDPAVSSLIAWLATQLTWHAVYCDERVLIFVQNDPRYLTLIARYKLHDNAVPPLALSPLHHDPEQQALSYYSRAGALLQMGFLQSARHDMEKGLTLAPDAVEYSLLAGQFALLQGETDKAKHHFIAAWRRAKNKMAGELLLKTCLQIASETSLKEGVSWSDEMAEIVDRSLLLLYKAQFLHLQGSKEKAAMLLQNLLRQYPSDTTAREYLHTLEQQLADESEQKMLQEIHQLSMQHKYTQALSLLQQEFARGRSNPEMLLEAGKIYWQNKQFATACDYFKKVVQTSPAHISGNCYLAMCTASLGEWQEALQILAPWQQKYADRYDVRLAQECVDTIAIEALQKEGDTLPHKPEQAFQLIQLLERQQRVMDAIVLLEKWGEKLMMRPPHKEAIARLYYDAGKRLLQEYKVATALRYLEHSVSVSPAFFDAHLLLAEIALKKHDWSNAGRHFEALKQLAPQDDRGAYGLALIELGKGLNLQMQNKYDEALEKFLLYLKKAPDGPEKKGIEERIANLQKMWQEQTKNKQARQYLENGTAALARQDWDTAIATLQEAISLVPDLAEGHFQLGQAYLRKKLWLPAEESFSRAIELRHHFPAAHLSLGYLYYQQGKFTEVKVHFTAYLQQSPDGKLAAQVKTILQSIEAIK
jgi:lipopolysaccharide biosynthesis regulator YciM